MERLTKYDENGDAVLNVPAKARAVDWVNMAAVALDRLAYYEDLEQQGRLVVLPCKVGDWVFRIYDDCTFPGDCGTKRMCKGCEYRNLFIEKQAFCLSMLNGRGTLGHPYYRTREEAEVALRRCRA